MVNVDPSDYDKYQNNETVISTENSQQTAPLYTIRVLENESIDIDITPSSISTQDEGFRSGLCNLQRFSEHFVMI